MSPRAALLPLLLTGLLAGHETREEMQEPPMVLKRVGVGTIVRVSPDGRVRDTLYRSTAADLFDVRIAPSGRFVGVVESVDKVGGSNRLTVLDASGTVARVVDRDVRAYVWCCREDWIVAVTGSYEEARAFTPTGVFIVDLEGGSEQRLDVSGVYEVTWASFDDALYFKVAGDPASPRIVRFDPRTGQSRLTEYRDLRFSPSGTFYLHYFHDITLGPPGPHIFERVTGREVPLPDPSLGAIEGWVFDQGDYLQLKRVRYPEARGIIRGREVIEGYTIYDVARGTVAASIQDSIRHDIIAPGGVLVLPGDGALKLVRSPSDIARD